MNLGGPKEVQTAQSSADDIKGQLDKRGYADKPTQQPPPPEAWSEEMLAELAKVLSAKKQELIKAGVPADKADAMADQDPDVMAERQRILREHNDPAKALEFLREQDRLERLRRR